MTIKELDASIRRVADFPKPGICFYDITSVLTNPEAFRFCVEALSAIVRASGAQAIAGIEARGFLFGAALAHALGMPLVLVRKKGKLPNPVVSQGFDLEYGSDVICVQELDLAAKRTIFLVDDLVATGGTLAAACKLFEQAGNPVVGIGAVIGLPFLGYAKLLPKHQVHTLIAYESE